MCSTCGVYGVWLMQVCLCRRWYVCACGCGVWVPILWWKNRDSLYYIQVLVGTRLTELELPSSSVLPGPVEGILSDVVNRSPQSRGDSWKWVLFQRTVPTSSSCGLGVDSFKYRWLWDVLLSIITKMVEQCRAALGPRTSSLQESGLCWAEGHLKQAVCQFGVQYKGGWPLGAPTPSPKPTPAEGQHSSRECRCWSMRGTCIFAPGGAGEWLSESPGRGPRGARSL